MKKKASRREERPALSKAQHSASLASGTDDFLIAAIGASAGGMEAFAELLRNLPTDTGMAFVLIQHLDPKHHSMLAELLSKETGMTVREVTDGMRVEADHVYVIPPDATMSISNHTLELASRGDSRGVHLSIDHFMRSLAESQGNRAIGVILSGFGTDGTLGMAEIQAHGGVTFAQDEATAKSNAMPKSVAAAGYADYVLPPKGISRELARIARHPYVAGGHVPEAELVPAEDHGLRAIFQLLRRNTGVDFTYYRQTTILRRIHRRMVVHKIDKIEQYVKHLRANPAEIKALYRDMLVNVTSFFRNPGVFDALKVLVFPKILESHSWGSAIRVWTPGCASGEETYSLAIALLEFLGEKTAPIQLFGTDVSEASVGKARSGLYPQNIEGDVSTERLRGFFTKVEGGYRVSKTIRDMCIFAQHNVLNDPPFSQMDVICCRNLLIYLEPALQNKVISLFHYATRPEGYLVLGTSEGVGAAANLFAPEDRALRIFSKRTAARQLVTFSLNRPNERAEYGAIRVPAKQPDSSWGYLEAQKEFDRRLLTQHTPATAFISEEMEVVHTRGNISRYLKLAPSRASLNIMNMAREGLLLDLRNAIARAKRQKAPVRKEGVRIKLGNGNGGGTDPERSVSFEVIPLTIGNLKEMYFMVVFQDGPVHPTREARPLSSRKEKETQSDRGRIAKLEQELSATKEYLQSVIETQEATNEELQSANEEILSSNEELQSTNEELETAKEELQSANEELRTVNDELRARNTEVSQANNDLTNVLSSIDMAIVMVGSDFTIRRFTPQAQRIFGLIPSDVGRPFTNINPTIEIPELQPMVLEVMSSFHPVERDVPGQDGSYFRLRIVPYRIADSKIDGAIVTVVEVSLKSVVAS
jgi:two-component system, chemotaxis family, CheB/CheR fusion protein